MCHHQPKMSLPSPWTRVSDGCWAVTRCHCRAALGGSAQHSRAFGAAAGEIPAAVKAWELHPWEMHPTAGRMGWQQAAGSAGPVLTPSLCCQAAPRAGQELSVPSRVAQGWPGALSPATLGESWSRNLPQAWLSTHELVAAVSLLCADLWVGSSLMSPLSHFLFL